MADSTYAFIHKGFTKAVFSDATTLNLISSDLGENMISFTIDGKAVERLNTATGTVPSANMFCPATVTLSVLKTSSADVIYKKKFISNNILEGTLTLYDDSNKPWVFSSLSMSLTGSTANGTEASRDYTIEGNIEVNVDLITELG